MGEVIAFVPKKKKKLSEQHKGNTLCKRGFHKWEVDKKLKFDTKNGGLVTLYRCARCGEEKIKSL